MDRRAVLQGALALCASAVVPRARACEYFTATLRIVHPWTRATGADAPFAVVCMKFDEVSETDRLIGAETPVAENAQLVGEFLIAKGSETVLSEDGSHIRLVGLKQPLLIARTYPLRLVFEKGGIANYRLSVDFLRPVQPLKEIL